tara:strand:+ start:1727 stop:3115 length:1389 start_codon:yes stop_codon:yes gene_type:complete
MKFDFVIVGSGPAGSILSDELSKKGFNIALIDRANNNSPQRINHFFCPYINKTPSYYTPLFSNVMGGNSLLWHSKVYLLSKLELSSYNWFIDYEELKKYSNILSKKLKINKSLITKHEKKNNMFYRYSYRANFQDIYDYLKIKKNNKIKVFRGYSPTKLHIKNNNVKKIIIKNVKQEKKYVYIKHDLIFCCGGLGNPHILLNLLKKKNKNLGKFLSDHPHINLGKIKVSELLKFKKILKPNIKLNLKIKTNEAALIFKIKKCFCGVQLDYKLDPMRQMIRFFIRIKNLEIRMFLNLFSFFVRKINGLFHMIGFFFKRYYKYSFEFFFSQRPNIRNKIYLTNKFDKFGLKKINIQWDLQKEDLKNYIKLIEKSSKNKKILINKDDFQNNFYKNGLSGQHPSCTTKIGKNDKDGVVNKDLKLFGYKNMYVVGSSVFPFIGYTNPTWTIMTLALRLAKRLIKVRN